MASPDQRKLAAIMFTDMVGFSALSQRDEALALELLEEQREIVRRFLAPHEGHEVKTIGDGFLIEFPSALEAVRAAVDIQTALHEQNAAIPPERRIQLRIGIHVGDVVVRAGDIHGDGVNIASRIEPLAIPGGICVSEDVERQVRNKLPLRFARLGVSELKNISLPVAVNRVLLPWEQAPAGPLAAGKASRLAWAWVALVLLGLLFLAWAMFSGRRTTTPLSTVAATSNSAAAVDSKSIAVLAFANLSDDKQNEYFSDGISEELLNVLSKIPGLKVSARTSAFFFKGKQVPLAEIAKQLGVAYVVEGSVRKSGDRLRITAQLINAKDGFHVWSDNFDRDSKDVFAVQDEIAALIAKNLQVTIDAGSSAVRRVNERALELYLQGRQAWNLRTPEGLARAENLFQRALEIDPGFARAYAGLADVGSVRASSTDIDRFGNRNSRSLADMVALSDRALALDPDSAEAYASLGNALWCGWQFAKAEAALQKAIALNPNYATAHQWLGRVYLADGRIEESIRELARAAVLDPLSPRILDNYSLMLQVQGKYAEALAVTERALALQPDSTQPAVWRAVYLSALGRNDEAVAQLRRISPVQEFYVPSAITVLVAAGRRPEAEQMMGKLSPNVERVKYTALAALGKTEEALASLSPDSVSSALVSDLYLNPDLDPIRNDPRFAQILATLGCTDANARARAWRAAHPLAPTR